MQWKDKKGAAAVEFALVLPVLLLILFGIIEFGIILYDKAVITNASREAARERINFNAPSPDAIRTRILQSYGNLPITFGSDTLTAEDITFSSPDGGIHWTATVRYMYNFLYLPVGVSLDMTASTTMRNE